jgi:hypothetical protein
MTCRWYGDNGGRAETQAEVCRAAAIAAGGFRSADGSFPRGPVQALLGYDTRWPLPNVWLGVSCEDQATADERIPVLLDTPAAVRFVSAEPLLGPVDLSHWLNIPAPEVFEDDPLAAHLMAEAIRDGQGDCRRGIDWVIVGGESGPGARPFDLAWARALVGQCRDAGVACFVKQLGAQPQTRFDVLHLDDRKGGDPAEWPEDLRVRQFPTRAAASDLPEKQEAAAGAGRPSPEIPAG